MKPTFAKLTLPARGTVVLGVLEGNKLTASAAALDKKTKGVITRAIKASTFKGKKGQTLTLMTPPGTRLDRVVLAGLGKPADMDAKRAEGIGGGLYAALAKRVDGTVEVTVDALKEAKMGGGDIAAHMAYGARLRSYRFDKYRTKEKKSAKPTLKGMKFLCAEPTAARKAYGPLDKVADGVFFTRDLVSEPANVIYPATLAAEAKKLKDLGVKIDVLDEKKMKALGMGALLGVAQGSANKPYLVVMHWQGGPKTGAKAKPVAFVGKGVTFDTGGISIKPSGGMEDMKWDMGGSGVVIGLMKALAGRKAKVNAVGVVGLVENMPSGTAQRPGDIVTSMSGQTIEVLNTDAEGRLVLADALHYTNDRFKPRFMVDLATLTGAIIVALGHDIAGLFSNDDKLSEQLTAAGKAEGEEVWRLPMNDAFDKMINSDAADMQNIGQNRAAGSITAAQFLQRFVGKTPWAHLDIAGVTWVSKDRPTAPKGGTGFGVRLLDRLVRDHYEG